STFSRYGERRTNRCSRRPPPSRYLGLRSSRRRRPLLSLVVRRQDSREAKSVNRWNIPDWLEQEVIERDRCCVYCGVVFVNASPTRRLRPSWEHIINDARIVNRENIVRCCISCNASKGTKKLKDWLESKYC